MNYNSYLSNKRYLSKKKYQAIYSEKTIDLPQSQYQSLSPPKFITNIPRNSLDKNYILSSGDIDLSSNPNVFLDSDINTVIYFKTTQANQTVFIYKEYQDQSGQTVHLDLNINNLFGTAEIIRKSFSLGDNNYTLSLLQSIESSTDSGLNFTIDSSKNQIGIMITPETNQPGQVIYCIIKNATIYRFSDNYSTNFGYNWVYQIGGGRDNGEQQNYTETMIEVSNNIVALKLQRQADNQYNSAKMLICHDNLILDKNKQVRIDVTAKQPISYDINGQIIDSSTNPILCRISLIGREYFQNHIKLPICGEIDLMKWSPTAMATYKTISTALHYANLNDISSPDVKTLRYDTSES